MQRVDHAANRVQWRAQSEIRAQLDNVFQSLADGLKRHIAEIVFLNLLTCVLQCVTGFYAQWLEHFRSVHATGSVPLGAVHTDAYIILRQQQCTQHIPGRMTAFAGIGRPVEIGINRFILLEKVTNRAYKAGDFFWGFFLNPQQHQKSAQLFSGDLVFEYHGHGVIGFINGQAA